MRIGSFSSGWFGRARLYFYTWSVKESAGEQAGRPTAKGMEGTLLPNAEAGIRCFPQERGRSCGLYFPRRTAVAVLFLCLVRTASYRYNTNLFGPWSLASDKIFIRLGPRLGEFWNQKGN